mmetsp:Transcript_43958/g.39186  ORF Transcript_43958/g.39186 Transcript_43958/m.39186 type:complete len:336 (-) Transcript_43958:47-1054(-)
MAAEKVKIKINKIDDGLSEYYEAMGRDDYYDEDDDGKGKFDAWCDDNGFEEDGDLEEDLTCPPADSAIPEAFDKDGVCRFPFEDPQPEEEEEKQERIMKIIRNILSKAKDGAQQNGGGGGGGDANDSKQKDDVNDDIKEFELDIEICNNLEAQELEDYTNKYTTQMNTLKAMNNRDGDLKWYLAIGKKQNYPFLTYMVDSFTKEKAEQYFAQKKTSTQALTVNTWAQKNKFFMALKKKYPQKADQLLSAMTNYCNRIMNRLQFQPIYKINDNLQQIVEYISTMPQFIRSFLIKSSKASPPFQVDLLIAVYEVQSQLADDNTHEEEDPDEDDDDEE